MGRTDEPDLQQRHRAATWIVANASGLRDDGQMPLTPAERQRAFRARKQAGESVPVCSACGARLQLSRRARADRQSSGLCWSCWVKTAAGQAAEAERKRKHVEADPERRRQQVREAAARLRARRREQSSGGSPS
jgi:hypothetical protein